LSTTLHLFARSERALKTVERAALGINIFMVFAMMITVVYGVIMRYVFNVPVRWVAEVSEFIMVALTFLALAHVQRQRKHINIKIFIERQSGITKAMLGVATDLAALVIFVLLTWASWGFAVKAWRSSFVSDAAAFPLFPPRLFVPLGAGVMCLQLLADLVHSIGSLLGLKVTKER
jgi:TRAP-type C4-dicarboxylate transport system permease small subunit